jgi:hypothetical protein
MVLPDVRTGFRRNDAGVWEAVRQTGVRGGTPVLAAKDNNPIMIERFDAVTP